MSIYLVHLQHWTERLSSMFSSNYIAKYLALLVYTMQSLNDIHLDEHIAYPWMAGLLAPRSLLFAKSIINVLPSFFFLSISKQPRVVWKHDTFRRVCVTIQQASRCVGKNSRVLVCHCRRVDNCATGACHCFQLQLLLSQRDRPGRDAVAKFQPCPELSLHARSLR